MSISTDVRYKLMQNATIAGLVSDRLAPVADQGHELPSMVYNISGAIPQTPYAGSRASGRTTIQVDYYTESYSELDTVRQALITEFHGFSGSIGESNTTRIAWSTIERSDEHLDNSDGDVYRLLVEISALTS